MDPKTKAMLHTAGTTVSFHDPAYLATHITTFPPEATVTVSDQMLADGLSKDPQVFIASLAKHISKQIAKYVEEQILKQWEMSAAEATKKLYAAQVAAYNDPNYLHFGDKKQDSLYGFNHLQWKTTPPPVPLKEVLDQMHATYFQQQFVKEHIAKPITPEQVKKMFGSGNVNYKPPGVFIEDDKPSPVIVYGEKQSKAKQNDITKVFHELIPGFAEMRQVCPDPGWEDCGDYYQGLTAHGIPFLQDTIIHLNDMHCWTREQIADWLETLDHDLTFKTPEEVKNAEHTH